MPRIVAFSPATALSRSSLFDSQRAEWQQSPELKSQQLKWMPSPRAKTHVDNEKDTPFDLDLDRSDMIGAFRLIESETASDLGKMENYWANDVHKLPLEAIAAFLSMSDLNSVMLTSRQWHSAFSRAPVWRMVFARKSHPQVISRRSHARSWRSLCLSGPRLSISELLCLQPEHCYFDMTPLEPCHFSPSSSNEILGHPRSPIIACLEILPEFYWTVLQTAAGFVHTGVVTLNGVVVVERGLDVAGRYLAALSPSGWRSLTMRSLTLLLVTLQAIPAAIAVSDAVRHEGSFLMQAPFRLVLRFRQDAPSTYYYFAHPGPARARKAAILPEFLTDALDLDENVSPGDSDSFATLQFCKRTNELVWTGRYSLRKATSS